MRIRRVTAAVSFPSSLKEIDAEAFSQSGLVSAELPDGVTLAKAVFQDCPDLVSVRLPGDFRRLPDYTFHGCSSLTDISFPDSLEEIGVGAFMNCTSLKNVGTFPEKLSALDGWAFLGCTALEKVTFSGDAPYIGENAFGTNGDSGRVVKAYYECTKKGWENVTADGDPGLAQFIPNHQYESAAGTASGRVCRKCGKAEIRLTGIALDKSELTFSGESAAVLQAVKVPADAAEMPDVKWSSSNPEVASAAASTTKCYAGNVKAINVGTAVITASAGGYTASCSVTVTEAFKEGRYRLTVVGGSGSGYYSPRETVTISPTEENEYRTFSRWEVTEGGLGSSFTDYTKRSPDIVTVSSDSAVKAVYTLTEAGEAKIQEEKLEEERRQAEEQKKAEEEETKKQEEERKRAEEEEAKKQEEELQKKISAFRSQIERLKAQISGLEKEKKSALSQLENVAGSTASIKKQIDGAGTDFITAQSRIGDLEPKLEEKTRADADDVESVLTGAASRISSAEKALSAAEKTIKNAKKKVRVTSIKISTNLSADIAAGKSVQLTVKVLPSNATNKKMVWTSSNKKYAAVSSGGKVTTKAAGRGKTVKITAKASDGSGKSATFTVRIRKGIVKKISLRGTVNVTAGKSTQLKANITASSGANKTLAWSSSNAKYAAVTSGGKVTTKSAGAGKSVKITAKATDGSGKSAVFTIQIKKQTPAPSAKKVASKKSSSQKKSSSKKSSSTKKSTSSKKSSSAKKSTTSKKSSSTSKSTASKKSSSASKSTSGKKSSIKGKSSSSYGATSLKNGRIRVKGSGK